MITFNDIFYKLPARGWLDCEEACLLLTFGVLTTGDILEVGSYCGRSSVLLASLGRTLHCVDNFHDQEPGEDMAKIFQENTKEYPNVILHKMPIEKWDVRPVGYAFLDGDHTYEGTKRQIWTAIKCGPKYIAMHDVNNEGQGVEVQRAAEGLLGEFIIRAGKMAIYEGCLRPY